MESWLEHEQYFCWLGLMLSACAGVDQKQSTATEVGNDRATQQNETSGQASAPKEGTDKSTETDKPEAEPEVDTPADPSDEAVKVPMPTPTNRSIT